MKIMINNFDSVNEIDLLLISVATMSSDRHQENASMILMELPSTLEWILVEKKRQKRIKYLNF